MSTSMIHRKRGRPKIARLEIDLGTPELQQKRADSETMEALDLCLHQGIITSQQHWCGIHLRWLYTLRYGAPGVRAIDLTVPAGSDHQPVDDPLWRQAREEEYQEAMSLIQKSGHAGLLSRICIHNERPKFLSPRTTLYRSDIDLTVQLCEGLDLLARIWRRK